MRKLFLFIIPLLLLTVFFSCKDSIRTPALTEAQTLLDSNPDSALQILSSLDTSLLNNDEKMLRRLLILAGKDKKYEVQPNDDEIKIILKYFIDNDRVKRLHPLVYYYAGRVYFDLRQYAQAQAYFKKSLYKLKEFPNINLEYRIHSQLASLYTRHNLFYLALKENKKSVSLIDSIYSCEPSHRNCRSRLAAYIRLGSSYRHANLHDSSYFTYNRISGDLFKLNDPSLISQYYCNILRYYLATDQLEKADSLLTTQAFAFDSINKNYILITLSDVQRNRGIYKYNKEQLLGLLNSQLLRERYFAAKSLADLASERNDAKELLKYSHLSYELSSQIQKEKNENSLVEMDKIVDETLTDNEILQLKTDKQAITSNLLLIIVIVSIMMIGCLIIIIRNAHKKIRMTQEFNKQKKENLEVIRTLQSEIENLKSTDELDERKKRIEEIESSLSLAEIADEILRLSTSPNTIPTQQHFSRLKAALSLTHPSFISALDSMNLKSKDYTDAMLIRINIPLKLCAQIFHVTPPAVANARNRLHKKYCQQTQYKNWKEYLDSL